MQTALLTVVRGNVQQMPLEPDALDALSTLSDQAALAASHASARARVLARAVSCAYADALSAASGATVQSPWRRFVRTVADFVFELDRCAPQKTFAAIVARRALDRIVLENADLLA